MKTLYIIFGTFLLLACIYVAALKTHLILPDPPTSDIASYEEVIAGNTDDDSTSELEDTKFA